MKNTQKYLVLALLPFCGFKSALARPFSYGDIVAVQQSSGMVFVTDPVSGFSSSIAQGLGDPSQVVVDSVGRILTPTRSSKGVARIDPHTGTIMYIGAGTMQYPANLAFENENNLLVGDLNRGIFRVNVQTGEQTLISLFTQAQDIEVGPDGTIYVLDFGSFGSGRGRVLKVDPRFGDVLVVAGGDPLFNPSDMSFSPDGTLLVLNGKSNTTSELLKVNLDTGELSTLFAVPFVGFISHESNDHIIIGDFNYGQLLRADLETGAYQLISRLGGYGNLTGVSVYRAQRFAVPELGPFMLMSVAFPICVTWRCKR